MGNRKHIFLFSPGSSGLSKSTSKLPSNEEIVTEAAGAGATRNDSSNGNSNNSNRTALEDMAAEFGATVTVMTETESLTSSPPRSPGSSFDHESQDEYSRDEATTAATAKTTGVATASCSRRRLFPHSGKGSTTRMAPTLFRRLTKSPIQKDREQPQQRQQQQSLLIPSTNNSRTIETTNNNSTLEADASWSDSGRERVRVRGEHGSQSTSSSNSNTNNTTTTTTTPGSRIGCLFQETMDIVAYQEKPLAQRQGQSPHRRHRDYYYYQQQQQRRRRSRALICDFSVETVATKLGRSPVVVSFGKSMKKKLECCGDTIDGNHDPYNLEELAPISIERRIQTGLTIPHQTDNNNVMSEGDDGVVDPLQSAEADENSGRAGTRGDTGHSVSQSFFNKIKSTLSRMMCSD